MKNSLFILFIAFLTSLNAQSIEVYFSKGDVKLLVNNKSVELKEGTPITEKATLKLAEGALIVLYHNDKAVVIKEAGSYSFADIESLFQSGKRSLSDKYIAYIWKQAHEKDGDDEDTGEGEMGVTGMVSRGEGGILFPVDSMLVITESFEAQLMPDVVPGTIYLYEKRKPIFNTEIDSASYLIEFGGVLEKGKWYGIAATAQQSAPYAGIRYFKWASDVEKQDIQMEMTELLAEIEAYPQDIKEQILDAFFKENKYIYHTSK